ncbi:MAG TPA: hypothetical protein VFR41_00795 [Acidimicrobiia bacterium]|nr:hypothetical protein [Acidimicrobiia bacterium]
MDLTLPPKLEEFVRAQVRAGRYVDEQDVVREAVRQMREIVKAAEDPNVVSVVKDAIGIATQVQRDLLSVLASADRQSGVFGEVIGAATAVANTAVEVVRKVPGAREVDRLLRTPVDQVNAAARRGEQQARIMRTNLEATAKALGVLTAVLERINSATRIGS